MVQIADGLTKDKEEPALKLRSMIREEVYQLAEEGAVLRLNKAEKERRAKKKAENLESSQEQNKPDKKKQKTADKTEHQSEPGQAKVRLMVRDCTENFGYKEVLQTNHDAEDKKPHVETSVPESPFDSSRS